MPILDSSIVGEYERFLLYGPPGGGKTHLAGTLPSPHYWLVLGSSSELKTLMGPAFVEKVGHPMVYYDAVEEPLGNRGHFEKAVAFDMACDKLDEALAKQKSGEWPFVSIIVDNATVLQELEMNKSMVINYDRVENKDKTALKRLRDENIIIPGDNDYMSAMSLMDQFVDWITRLPFHLAFVAHDYVETSFSRTTRQTNVTHILPLFVGKQRIRIPRAFDNVWYITAQTAGTGIVSMARTSGTEPMIAKTRVGGVFPQTIQDPNLTISIAKMKKATSTYKSPAAPAQP